MMYTTVVPLTDLGQFDIVPELTLGSDGLLYGAVPHSGAFGHGSLYKTSIDGVITFIPFDGTNGDSPGVPVQAPDGKFYGAASTGGSMGAGTVYCLETNGNLKAIYSFDMTNGGNPSGLIMRTNGELYGMTLGGGSGYDGTPYSGAGVFFKMTTNGQFTLIANFTETNAYPFGPYEGSDGNFYGYTGRGGAYHYGTIFRMTPDGQMSTLVTFDGTNGAYVRRLTLGSDGAFYGCTGGTNPPASSDTSSKAFRLTTNGDFTILHTFSSGTGVSPFGALLEVTNGLFYGTTYYGGLNGSGTIFQLTTNGDYTVLLNFDSTWSKNSLPITGLTKGPDGNYYGITSHPRREIYCLRPVEAPALQYSVQDGQINFSWKAWGGLAYQLRCKTNLEDLYWLSVAGTLSDTNTVGSYSEPIDPNAPRSYTLRINIRENWWGLGPLPYP
jgi:uncharacterized repeat protein (TIGR03803 family)